MAERFESFINDVRFEGYPEPYAPPVLFRSDGIWYQGWPLSGLETDDDGLLLWEANGGDTHYGVRLWMLAPEQLRESLEKSDG